MKVRLQVAEGGPSPRTPSALDMQWRGVASLEHGVLCRAFSLDPVRHRWDLPRSARVGEGSAYATRGSDQKSVV